MESLTAEEIRVLGCLIEKEATTPYNYPLSSNALVGACNQSTNRDPVVTYTERIVDQAVLGLREKGLARTVRGDGQRVHKHRHVAGEVLHTDAAGLALLSVLMLRGPQTESELRARTERYDVDLHTGAAVDAYLQGFAGRVGPLTRRLERRPGEREPRWIHLLGGEALAEAQAAALPATAQESRPTRVASLDAEVVALQAELRELTRRFDTLCEMLGQQVP